MRTALWWESLLLIAGTCLLVGVTALVIYCILYGRSRRLKQMVAEAEKQRETDQGKLPRQDTEGDLSMEEDAIAAEREIHHAHQPVPHPITTQVLESSATISTSLPSPLFAAEIIPTPSTLEQSTGKRAGATRAKGAARTKGNATARGRPRWHLQ